MSDPAGDRRGGDASVCRGATSRLARALNWRLRMRLVVVVVVVVLCAAGCYPPGYGDRRDASVDGGGGPDAMAVADAGPDAARVQCDGRFRLDGHDAAGSVWLTGDFVGWAGTPEAGAVALALGIDGAWTGTRTFGAGSFQYRFIVDGGSWIADPANPETVDDGFGGVNSVYRCQ